MNKNVWAGGGNASPGGGKGKISKGEENDGVHRGNGSPIPRSKMTSPNSIVTPTKRKLFSINNTNNLICFRLKVQLSVDGIIL